MTNKPHDVTAQAVVQFTRILFGVLSEKNGGNTTLNELRVMNQIILCHVKGRCCSVTALHKVTRIPIPTVSRVVAHLQYSGYLSDRRDPNDGRKRIISLAPESLGQTIDEIDNLVNIFSTLETACYGKNQRMVDR